MTSTTQEFDELEEQYYEDPILNDRSRQKGQNQHRESRILNESLVMNETDKQKRIKLIEYDILKRLIKCFQRKNFTKISFLYGGYEKVHNLIETVSGAVLIDHDKYLCTLCQANKNPYEVRSISLNNKKLIKQASNEAVFKDNFRQSMNIRRNPIYIVQFQDYFKRLLIGMTYSKEEILELLKGDSTIGFICYLDKLNTTKIHKMSDQVISSGKIPILLVIYRSAILIFRSAASKIGKISKILRTQHSNCKIHEQQVIGEYFYQEACIDDQTNLMLHEMIEISCIQNYSRSSHTEEDNYQSSLTLDFLELFTNSNSQKRISFYFKANDASQILSGLLSKWIAVK